ncbi:uncharacterized protein LOC128224060 isoform X2 [Mya arenaria]|uniref:uncharacterized protein LOC128224060 isoform X2 n=1 Tax=Mya arenaria TaxID=6604 RepID=UPI0022DF1512|nr:uncharacterized protein LOC128224060 isoform X2 [Mya arenaria]
MMAIVLIYLGLLHAILQLCFVESKTCEQEEFKCGNLKCVQMAFYCDTDDDCGDMSDEPQGCVKRRCGRSMIRCFDGSCLTQGQLCRGFTCLKYVTDISAVTCLWITCADHQFQCLNGICIDKSHVCNGIRDCLDGTDEGTGCNEPTSNVSTVTTVSATETVTTVSATETITTVSATIQTSNEGSNVYLLAILPGVGWSLGLCLFVFVGLLCYKRKGRLCFSHRQQEAKTESNQPNLQNESQAGESSPMSVFPQIGDDQFATVNEIVDLRKGLQNVNDDLEKAIGGKMDANNSNTSHSDDVLEQHMDEIRTDANDKLYCNQYENDQQNLVESHFGVNDYENLGKRVQNVNDDLGKTNHGKMDANNSKTTHPGDVLEQHMDEIRTDANDALYCNHDQPNLQMESHSGVNEYANLDANNSNTTHSGDVLEQHMDEIRTDANDKLYCNQ